jgi:hypothetical protein
MFNDLAIDKIKFYGDFNIKLNSTYKLLCSVYLKKNDMQSAAKFLQNVKLCLLKYVLILIFLLNMF